MLIIKVKMHILLIMMSNNSHNVDYKSNNAHSVDYDE
jgi:hypothetical protein